VSSADGKIPLVKLLNVVVCNLQEQDSTIMGYSFSKHLNLHDCLENKFFYLFFQ
jgi:hypothetical protein